MTSIISCDHFSCERKVVPPARSLCLGPEKEDLLDLLESESEAEETTSWTFGLKGGLDSLPEIRRGLKLLLVVLVVVAEADLVTLSLGFDGVIGSAGDFDQVGDFDGVKSGAGQAKA